MIIIGYPGIGKSYSANEHPCVVDLDSSRFKSIFSSSISGRWDPNFYVDLAIDIAGANTVVCVSSHKEVTDLLLSKKYIGEIYVVYPSLDRKEKWLRQLYSRVQMSTTDKEREKNSRALLRATDHFEEDINYLKQLPFDQVELNDDNQLDDWLKKCVFPYFKEKGEI